jgi:hypothetical protein
MTVPSATKQTALRVDRLLRSLVGVADVRPVWDAAGVLRLVHVLKADTVRDDQLVRNVVSGLKAGFGIRVQPASVRVHGSPDAFSSMAGESDAGAPSFRGPAAPVVEEVTVATNGNGNGKHGANGNGSAHHVASESNGNGNGHHHNGNGHHPANGNANGYHASNGKGNGFHAGGGNANGSHLVRPLGGEVRGADVAQASRVAAFPPDAGFPLKSRTTSPERETITAEASSTGRSGGPCLERIDIERHGAMLRCRVTLVADACRYSGIAEAPDRAGADVELAASVTLDALRAGGFTTARLDGLGQVTIGSAKYVVASLRAPAAESTTAGAAPVGSSALRAAALAVLGAVAS